jgi:hypothetical protein
MPSQRIAMRKVKEVPPPDYVRIHQELKRKGVTLELLRDGCPGQRPGRPYGYTRFCVNYRCWTRAEPGPGS